MVGEPRNPYEAPEPHSPVVRIAVLLHRRIQDSFLVAKCTGTLGKGQYRTPGGYLEYGETFLAAATRIVRRETALEVIARRIAAVDGEVMGGVGQERHYITIFVLCEPGDDGDEPEIREPEECDGWEWKTWDQLRHEAEREMEMPLANILEGTQNGEVFLRRSL